MKVFTDDDRFLKVTLDDKQKEDVNMCMILDQIEEEGRQKGIQVLSDLITILMKQGKTEELQHAAQDRTYCEQLLKDYQLL